MAYEIHYGQNQFENRHAKSVNRKWIPVICVIALIAGVLLFDLEGYLGEWLLPGDPTVTAVALENMQQNLKSGETVFEAVSAFCQEVVDGANLAP